MLTSLTILKSHLLPPALRSRTDFDTQLTLLGCGVLAGMEGFLNRKLVRLEDAVEKVNARCTVVSLSRFPIEAVPVIQLTTAGPTGTTSTITDYARVNLDAGLVHFFIPPGAQHDTLTLTYTGGFWIDTSAEQDGELPAGATALEPDILTAWLLQMKAVTQAMNLFNTAAAGSKDNAPTDAASLDLSPLVKDLLNDYRRFA